LRRKECGVEEITEIGFYWAKTHTTKYKIGKWIIAFLSEDGWQICGSGMLYPDEAFEEIGEKITPYMYQPIQEKS
jgi:hypothetical protein